MDIKEIMAKERRAVLEAFGKGNVDALDEVFAPDAVFHGPPFPDIEGLEAYKQYVLASFGSFTVTKWDWEETIIEGNTAAQRATIYMKHTGSSPMLPGPPTGKDVTLKSSAFYHIKNGKVVEFFGYDDMLGLFQQMGIVPPMGQE